MLVAGPLVGALLILVTDAPFWLVNVVAGIVYTVTMPFVALTTAYVYFDTRIRHELADEREPAGCPRRSSSRSVRMTTRPHRSREPPLEIEVEPTIPVGSRAPGTERGFSERVSRPRAPITRRSISGSASSSRTRRSGAGCSPARSPIGSSSSCFPRRSSSCPVSACTRAPPTGAAHGRRDAGLHG